MRKYFDNDDIFFFKVLGSISISAFVIALIIF
jgi:hypothetical protein